MDEDVPASSPLTSPPLTIVVTSRPQSSNSVRAPAVFVEVQSLRGSEREEYKRASETPLKDMLKEVDEVIGEYQDGNTLYYFARFQEGIAHRFPSQVLQKDYPAVVEAYKKAKKSRAFKHAKFDPSAHYIHPLSRVKVKITLSPKLNRARASISSRGNDGTEYVPDSQEEEEEEGEESDAYVERTTPPRPIRKTRQAQLPFSPRKSRSQHVVAIDDSESEQASAGPARRITRGRAVKVKLGSEYSGSEDEENDSEYAVNSKPTKAKRVNRSKFPLPSYGNIRSVAALDYDDYPSDATNAPLRGHRALCEKCQFVPAHELLQTIMKKGKSKKRKRGVDDEFDYSDEEDRYTALGGWVRCLKCPVAAHWGCMAGSQREEILQAAREKDKRDWEVGGNDPNKLVRRKTLEVDETTEFICGPCHKGGVCIGCMEIIPPPTEKPVPKVDANGDVEMVDGDAQPDLTMPRQLHFRCFTCKRMAHYEHLPVPHSLPSNSKLSKVAVYYQYTKGWLCADCSSFRYPLDKIIAWRPYPANVKETAPPSNYKEQLPREYLVKWTDRSYRRLSWVPHMWLVSTNAAKLKNFLSGGTKVELLKQLPDDEAEPSGSQGVPFEIGAGSRASSAKPYVASGPLGALPDAEKWIIPAFKTVERVLDVLFWDDERKKKGKEKAIPRRSTRIVSDDEDVDMEDELPEELRLTFEQGQQPSRDFTMGLSEWEKHTGKGINEDDVHSVVWAFFKWGDLGYDEASWDSPPRRGEPGHDAFVTAFKRYLYSRSVEVPEVNKKWLNTFENRPKDEFRHKHLLRDPAGLQLDQDESLKLMPFQVDGFNWLCNNWWNHQPCILADDMGLGKTVQMAAFLGTIATKWKAFPALVVVPNSTITNWVREFERWAPNLRVVPFYGEKKAREIIKQFELYHPKSRKGFTNAKFHVLITTYEGITNPKDFGVVFKKQPRWEALVIDEGQRLKSDSSLLFKKLNELNSAHRVIMTGTPLNNNMRELFNLMNFLDPKEWNDLEALEKEYAQDNLNEDMIKDLHNRLRPYFLRRIKSEVLDLPAKNEVIIPVSMAPLQRQVYRSILSHNLDLLKGLTQQKKGNARGKLNNVLMHLRKCLQHPYLYSEDIEPAELSPQEAHVKLIDASAKLRFLKTLLPKLQARGHRVLLFSQFVLALNIVEDFLRGEGFKYLRLDGNTKGSDRQKSMDEYNKPDSEVFVFLLTTRAGGVGINLFTADTVIIFDPDFNPHQDLQAIARAYRYGQKKTCLVFKLMVKDSAEERIMQIGKKKLVLDHLIVQKMDDDEDGPKENVESILTYGAQALFESDQAAKDITYSEHDIDQLIEKTEKEGDETDAPKEGLSFTFAKIWSAEKDQLEEVADEDEVDAWAQTLERINEERAKEMEQETLVSGRGARRKAADMAKTKMVYNPLADGPDSPRPRGRGSNRSGSEVSAFGSPHGSADENGESGSDSSAGEPDDEDFEMAVEAEKKMKGKRRSGNVDMAPTANGSTMGILKVQPTGVVYQEQKPICGLCGGRHGPKECGMTNESHNLAEYREMLILHADDEPWEERSAAIRAIDEILNARGDLHLIQGQPLHPLPKATAIPPTKKPKETMEMVAVSYQEKQKAKQQKMGPPTTTSARPRSQQEQRSGIRDYSTKASSSSSGQVRGNGVVVQSRPSGSGSRVSTAAALPAALSQSSLTSLPSTSSSSGSPAVRGAIGDPCVVCGSGSYHFLKECPVVMRGPRTVSQLITLFEQGNDSKKADTVVTLRRILAKQKRQQGPEMMD